MSLVPSVTETLFALGLDEQIVAITRFCKLPADKVQNKLKVGGTKSPSLKKILDLKPDIVVMDCDENRKQDADFLEKQGIRIFARIPKSIEDSIQLIEELGDLFEAQVTAKAICREIQQRMNKISKTVSPVRTLILIWQNPYMSINHDTYCDAVCKFFGFENVFEQHTERYPKLSAEEIRSANPAIVLFPDEPFPFRKKHIEQFARDFSALPAVQ
ncbi:MAG TPA: helical backbone metal receptor, partial [Acidobacteriota bacterium]|nr:helical backbone metal receptor [Acidobacteriota bacterium]